MNPNELEEIMNWIVENFENLPLSDQFVVLSETAKFVENIKPIYLKNALSDGKSTFFFKM